MESLRMDTAGIRRFTYPDQRSTCDALLETPQRDDSGAFITRMRISAGYSDYGPPFHMLGLHLGATAPLLHRRETYEAFLHFRAGDSFFSPLGASLESARPDATDALYIFLRPDFVAQVAETVGIDPRGLELRAELGADDPVVRRIGLDLLREALEPGVGGEVYTGALYTQLCVHLIRRYGLGVSERLRRGVSPLRRHDLRRAIEFIHAHLSRNVTLAEIAAVEHLSQFHFQRLFKQVYGVSPHQYIIEQRVRRAQELLRNPRLTVNEVALAVGFNNHSHLIRHFKRLTGATPRGALHGARQNAQQDSAQTSATL